MGSCATFASSNGFGRLAYVLAILSGLSGLIRTGVPLKSAEDAETLDTQEWLDS